MDHKRNADECNVENMPVNRLLICGVVCGFMYGGVCVCVCG